MSVEGIKISLGEVSKTAGTIKTLNQSLTTRLEEMKKEMNNLNSTWQSDAATTIVQNFNALAPKFNEYHEIVEAYAKFLDNTVASYDAAETAINNNASAFR